MISVIIPLYNQGQFLNDALMSVEKQMPDLSGKALVEVIIVNDGSTDNLTNEILKETEKKKFSFELVVVWQENKGLSGARNAGLKVARGDYLQFLDSDDLLLKNKLANQINEFQKRSGLKIGVCSYVYGSSDLKDIWRSRINTMNLKWPYLNHLLLEWESELMMPAHCFLIRKNSFLDLYFEENLKAKEDWVFWVNLFSQIKDPGEVLIEGWFGVIYRQHQLSMTKADPEKMKRSWILAYEILKSKFGHRENIGEILENIKDHRLKKYDALLQNGKGHKNSFLRFFLKFKSWMGRKTRAVKVDW